VYVGVWECAALFRGRYRTVRQQEASRGKRLRLIKKREAIGYMLYEIHIYIYDYMYMYIQYFIQHYIIINYIYI